MLEIGGRTYQTFRNFYFLPVIALSEYGGDWCINVGWGRWGFSFWVNL